jgi:hypothetical protein
LLIFNYSRFSYFFYGVCEVFLLLGEGRRKRRIQGNQKTSVKRRDSKRKSESKQAYLWDLGPLNRYFVFAIVIRLEEIRSWDLRFSTKTKYFDYTDSDKNVSASTYREVRGGCQPLRLVRNLIIKL